MLASRLAYVVYVIVVVCIGSELLLRGYFLVRNVEPAPVGIDPKQRFFRSSSYIHPDRNGALRASPNTTIREVSYSADSIEFDVTFRTNNLGLIDHEDYAPGSTAKRRLAFVGDSFTAGTGAPPWVPLLRDRLRREGEAIDIYNLGVAGSGFWNFSSLVRSVQQDLPIDELFVLAICHDFGRPNWVPKATSEGIWFCRPGEASCTDEPPHVHLIEFNEAQSDIIARARKLSSTVQGKSVFRRLVGQSYFAKEVNRVHYQFVQRRTFYYQLEADRPAIADLAKFKGPKYFLHLPERDETHKKSYKCEPRQAIESYGFTYVPMLQSCGFSVSDYHPHDPHFHSGGTQKLESCVREYLKASTGLKP